MPRRGQFTNEMILQAALEVIDESGINKLSINSLARKLEIQPPSIYNYFENLEDLRIQVSVQVHIEITAWIKKAIKGKKSKKAVLAMALSWREYALKYPGRYNLSSTFPTKESKEWKTIFIGLRDFTNEILKSAYVVSDTDSRSAARALRSLIHGFVMFEFTDGWSQIINVDKSFKNSIGLLMKGLELTALEYSKKSAKKRSLK